MTWQSQTMALLTASAAPCAGRRRVADSSRSESPAPGLASRGLVGCAGRHAVIAGGERDRAPLETAGVAPPRGRRNPDPASDERYERLRSFRVLHERGSIDKRRAHSTGEGF